MRNSSGKLLWQEISVYIRPEASQVHEALTWRPSRKRSTVTPTRNAQRNFGDSRDPQVDEDGAGAPLTAAVAPETLTDVSAAHN